MAEVSLVTSWPPLQTHSEPSQSSAALQCIAALIAAVMSGWLVQDHM